MFLKSSEIKPGFYWTKALHSSSPWEVTEVIETKEGGKYRCFDTNFSAVPTNALNWAWQIILEPTEEP